MQDWDAPAYHRLSDPQARWAARVLDRLPLRGDETVLDAGCGSGRVTRLLLERLPAGRVYGVDHAASMLAVAQESLAEFGERVILLEADLTDVRLPQPVDAIFSNATFHWIRDHRALFANLARNLRPGGWLVAQCGGAGNIARVQAAALAVASQPPFAPYLAALPEIWRYATAEETAALLAETGFTDIETALEASPAPFPSRAAYATYLATVILWPFRQRLPESLQADYVEAVVAATTSPGQDYVIDYVRLNLRVRRAGP